MISIPRLSVSLLLALISLSAAQAYADELIMHDGSRLFGKVVKREGTSLEFKTPYAGVVMVKWGEVSELHTDEPMKLMLRDASILTAQHIRNAGDVLFLDENIEPHLSKRSLSQNELEFINPDPWRTGDGYKLDGHINFALEKERGNTDKDEVDIDTDLAWRFLHYRFRTFGELERDHSNNKKTKDKWKLNNDYDYFISRKRYIGLALNFESDQFADLNLRTIAGLKTGYQWFETRDMNLSTEIGPMYVREDFDADPNDDYAALRWSVNFDQYVFGDFMQFYHRNNGLWSVENTGDLVLDSWTGFRIPMLLGVIVSVEMQVDYNTRAAEDADELDTTFSLKLGYKW